MTGRKAIEDTLYEFVSKELLGGESDGLTASTNLLALGVIDSLAIVSLRLVIERTYRVRLPDGLKPEDFNTISAIAGMVERLQRAAGVESSGGA